MQYPYSPLPRYTFHDGLKAYKTTLGKKYPRPLVPVMEHSSHVSMQEQCVYFNRAMKRERDLAVCGDMPVFALMTTEPVPATDPPYLRLCQFEITIRTDKFHAALDEADEINTYFYPAFTRYEISFAIGVCVELTVWSIQNGLAFSVKSINTDVHVDIHLSGMNVNYRTLRASYFQNINPHGVPNGKGYFCKEMDNCAITGCEEIRDVAGIMAKSPRAQFTGEGFTAAVNVQEETRYICYYGEQEDVIARLKSADFSEVTRESESFFNRVVDSVSVSTPDMFIDGGLYAAVCELEYNYTDPGWLEGGHWWSCYWCMNYQLSAALLLGQFDKLKKALIYFGTDPYGFGVFLADAKLESCSNKHYDYLPYYVWQLGQYVRHTGDYEPVEAAYDNMMKTLRYMLIDRDRDNDGIIDWHFHSNAFLYQADHLGSPNAASSPSLILDAVLRILRGFAEKLGQAEDIQYLTEKLHKLQSKILTLFDHKRGYFYNCIDYEGVQHKAHYYSDLCFAALYSSVPQEISWLSLEHLKSSLIYSAPHSGRKLMRVGDFKPSCFSCDNVMPVQMDEAARALAKTGEFTLCAELLSSTGYGSTLYTESPGSFPERFDDDGKGEHNFIFGNPIGSYIYTVIDGLFGLSMDDGGKTLCFEPGFPDDYPHAALHLNWVEMEYSQTMKGDAYSREYHLKSDASEMRFSTQLPLCKDISVKVNGEPVAFASEPVLGRVRITCHAPINGEAVIALAFTRVPFASEYPVRLICGQQNVIVLPFQVDEVKDVQDVFKNCSVTGNTLSVLAHDDTGDYSVFVKPVGMDFYVKIAAHTSEAVEVTVSDAVYDIHKGTLTGDMAICAAGNITQAEVSTIYGGCSYGALVSGTTQMALPLDGIPVSPRITVKIQMTIDGQIFMSDYDVRIQPADQASEEAIAQARRAVTQFVDISERYNTRTLVVNMPWVHFRPTPILPEIITEDNMISTPIGSFMYLAQENTLCKIELSTSHEQDRTPIPSDMPSTVTFPVNLSGNTLLLLYANETEVKNTYENGADITVTYTDNNVQLRPLHVFEELDTLWRSTVTKAVSLPLPVEQEGDPGFASMSYINALAIPIDPTKTVRDVTVSVKIADLQIGIIGMSIIGA